MFYIQDRTTGEKHKITSLSGTRRASEILAAHRLDADDYTLSRSNGEEVDRNAIFSDGDTICIKLPQSEGGNCITVIKHGAGERRVDTTTSMTAKEACTRSGFDDDGCNYFSAGEEISPSQTVGPGDTFTIMGNLKGGA